MKALVNIDSRSGSELEIVSYLEKELRSWEGVRTKRYRFDGKRFNLLARHGKGHPVFCLNSHADTVPPSGRSVARATIRGGVLLGLGACDTKASLAAMITALRRRVASGEKPSGTLDLLITIDEERRSSGAHSVMKQGYRCDYAIVGEPTGLEIVAQHMGQIMLEIRARGKSVHSSAPWKGVNAIEELNAALAALRPVVEDGKRVRGIGAQSMSLGAIHGGDVGNRVPASCRALVDVRTLPGRGSDRVLSRMEAVLRRRRNISYTVIKNVEPMKPCRDAFFVRLVQGEVRRITGKNVHPAGARYWTEAADFRDMLDAGALVLGPGQTRYAHSGDERVRLRQVCQAAELYYAVARKVLSTPVGSVT